MKTLTSTFPVPGLGWLPTLAVALSAVASAGLPRVPTTTAVDLDGDQRRDLVLVVEENLWIRRGMPRPESSWQPLEPGPGLPAPIDSLATVDLDGDGIEDLVVSGREMNQAMIYFGQSDLSLPLRTARLELPGGVMATDADFPVAGGPATAHFLATATLQPYVARVQAGESSPITATRFSISIDGVEPARVLDLATYNDPTSRVPLLAFLMPAPGPSGPRADANAVYVAELDPAGAVRRCKFCDITLKRGYTVLLSGVLPDTLGTPALVAWTPGAPAFATLVPRTTASGSELITEEVEFAVETITYHRAPGTRRDADRYLALGRDGGTLVLFRWSGAGRLEPLETVFPPAGRRFAEARLLGEGSLAAFLVSTDPAASPEPPGLRLGIYESRNGKLELALVQELPVGSSRSSRPRVVLYDRNPFADPMAFELQSFPAGDWTRSGSVGRGSLAISAEVFRDRRRGLGDAASRSVEVDLALPSDAFPLPNQWEADSSVFFGGSSATPGLAPVQPNPPPGTYAGPIEVSWTIGAGVSLFSRPSGGAWREGSAGYRIGTSITLEYYGVNRSGEAGPRRQARYQIAEPDSKPSGPLQSDTDMDGMDDGWERLLFGGLGVKASDDTDGDGFGAADEYRAGTDPRNPASRPTGGGPTPPVLEVRLTAGGQPVLRWSATSGGRYQVEVSADLTGWTAAAAPPTANGGDFELRDESPRDDLRFYRVVALP